MFNVRTCRWCCSHVPDAVVLPDESGRGFGRFYLRIFGEFLQCVLSIAHSAATKHRWWRDSMFVDVVLIKRAALSWMASRLLSVCGATPIQASWKYSTSLLTCALSMADRFWGVRGELLVAVLLASDLLLQPMYLCCDSS